MKANNSNDKNYDVIHCNGVSNTGFVIASLFFNQLLAFMYEPP